MDNQITGFSLATSYGYPIRGALGTVEVINGRIGVSPPYQQEEESVSAAMLAGCGGIVLTRRRRSR
ncbi:MAG TPA: hypothetical protein VHX86_08365 [Tepidisphaeraceae bacterium]|nr:hypothetical protein [Tepidisphaeraceae bacterium]